MTTHLKKKKELAQSKTFFFLMILQEADAYAFLMEPREQTQNLKNFPFYFLQSQCKWLFAYAVTTKGTKD